MDPGIFRAYDIRGIVGEEFEPTDFYSIAQAYARVIRPATVAVGHGVRETSPMLWQQVVERLTDAGVNVLNIAVSPRTWSTSRSPTTAPTAVSSSRHPTIPATTMVQPPTVPSWRTVAPM